MLSLALGRLDGAEAVLKRAEERNLESEDLLADRYTLAFLRGDADGMARVAATLANGKPHIALTLQGFTEAYYGRLRNSRELLGRATESAKREGAVDRAAVLLADAGTRDAYLGDMQHAWADADAGLRLAAPREAQYEASMALALAGDTEHAEKIIAQMNNRFPLDTWVQRFYLPTTRAAVALAQKNPNKTIEWLRDMTPYELGGVTALDGIYLRGQAYLMLHNGTAPRRPPGLPQAMERRRPRNAHPEGSQGRVREAAMISGFPLTRLIGTPNMFTQGRSTLRDRPNHLALPHRREARRWWDGCGL